MRNNYSITPEAKMDFEDAVSYFNTLKVRGLTNKFILEIGKSIRRAAQNPLFFAVRYDNVRLCLTKTFSYAIHFYIEDTTMDVKIIAITHTGKDRESIQSRLKH